MSDDNIVMRSLGERGQTGLRRYSGYIREEFLTELQGRRGVQTYDEMINNDDVIGAVLFAMQMLIRQVDWTVELPPDPTPEDRERQAFLESCFQDMEQSWSYVLSEILSMLGYGWSFHEVVYKVRAGANKDLRLNSRFDDNLIGWRSLPIRGQDSLLHWEFASDEIDVLTGFTQIPAPSYRQITIPMSRGALFRPGAHKNNPEGRALALDTPVPTPNGWTTMGGISVGQPLFDDKGRICYVEAKSEVWQDRRCYELEFSDGSTIIADENHEWHTLNYYERVKGRPGKIRTTKQIFDTQRFEKQNLANHCIPWAPAVEYPEQQLLIDPHCLGLWLGDGHTYSSRIYTNVDDIEEQIGQVRAVGYNVISVTDNTSKSSIGTKGRYFQVGSDVQSILGKMGLLNNKHIPKAYLRSSKEQRLELLRGLMDSDGTVDRVGRCDFTNINYELIEGTAELVRSLGCSASIVAKKTPDTSNHPIKRKNQSWRVSFTPSGLFNPFKLDRKRARVLEKRSRKQHYIRFVREVSPRPTVCIEVSSKSHLFLAGKSFIPTHNSILRNSYKSYYMKNFITNIEGIGLERDLAGLPVLYVPPRIMQENASAADKALYAELQKVVVNLKRDEQEGLILPAAYDAQGNRTYDLQLLASGGSRQINTTEIVERYDRRIAMTVMADFLFIGHSSTGSYALIDNKTDIFAVAIKSYVDAVSEVFNRKLIPDLWEKNGWETDRLPKWVPSDIESPDLEKLGNYVSQLAGAGYQLFDQKTEAFLRKSAGLPVESFTEEDFAAMGAGTEETSEVSESNKGQTTEDGEVPHYHTYTVDDAGNGLTQSTSTGVDHTHTIIDGAVIDHEGHTHRLK